MGLNGSPPAMAAPARRRRFVGLAAGGAILVAMTVGPVPAITLAVLLWCLARARQRSRGRRRRAGVRQAAEDLLAAFAAELDAGAAPADALRAAARDIGDLPAPAAGPPGWLALDALGDELAGREDPSEPLRRSEAAPLRQLGIAYQVCDAVGARLAPIAAMLAAITRADAVRAGELTAALAGPRSSGRLVAALPLAGLALGSLAGAAPVPVLMDTPAGIACLAVGGLTDLVGLRWLRHLAERVEKQAAPVAVAAASVGTPRSTGRDRLVADFPLALDLIAACLRSGGTTASALAAVGTATGGVLGAELRAAGSALSQGATMESACERLIAASRVAGLAERLPRAARLGQLGRRGRLRPVDRREHRVARPRWLRWPGRRASATSARQPPESAGGNRWPRIVRAAIAALERAETSGAKLAATLTRLADRARDENHADSIAAARRAGVLAVAPLGLCFLPAFLLLGVVPVVLGSAPDLLPA